ncbi:MAG: CoA pyrophosphatase, partial [Alphaproteobacteria bacterium]
TGRPVEARSLRAAGVLVPIVDRPDGPTVLLTQRTAHLQKHAGQISFPGGGHEPQDADLIATALRETEEEIGLPPERVTVLGRLDLYETSTAYGVVPVVGWIETPFPMRIDPFEVAEVFEVPLAFVMDPANHRRDSVVRDGRRRSFYVLPFQDRYIWGATAGMLVNLYEVLRD